MYSRTTWGGPVDPFILVKFLHSKAPEKTDPIASLLIFEWKDKDLVGRPDPNYPGLVSSRAVPERCRILTHAAAAT